MNSVCQWSQERVGAIGRVAITKGQAWSLRRRRLEVAGMRQAEHQTTTWGARMWSIIKQDKHANPRHLNINPLVPLSLIAVLALVFF